MRAQIRRIIILLLVACVCISTATCGPEDDGTISTDFPTGGMEYIEINGTIPSDGESYVSVDNSISVLFSEAMDASTITVNTNDNTCSDVIQLSADDFVTCALMYGAPIAGNSNKSFTVNPASNLWYGLNYKIRVTGGLKNVPGENITVDYTMEQGFQTPPAVTCDSIPTDKLMTTIAFGQSNSTDSGIGQRTIIHPKVFTIKSDGTCAYAQDPLSDTWFAGVGSAWTRLGSRLVNDGIYDAVLLLSVGVSGTGIEKWIPAGDYHYRIQDAISLVQGKDFTITNLLWHQGETDSGIGTTKADYKTMFHQMLNNVRQNEANAPIYVAVATFCGGDSNATIQQAQTELVDPSQDIYAGPNTDSLGSEYRYDGCHFNEIGLERHADLWFDILK